MTLHVELAPEIESQLTSAAEMRGLAPAEYAQEILRQALSPRPQPTGKVTAEEMNALLRQMAEGWEKLPVLPEEAFSREGIYEEPR
jgi:hypothetical protein